MIPWGGDWGKALSGVIVVRRATDHTISRELLARASEDYYTVEYLTASVDHRGRASVV